MKKVEGFKMRSLGKERIILPESGSMVNFNKMISLNSSAAYLWEAIGDSEFTTDTLKELLIEKYGIDNDLAAHDAASLAESWIEIGIVSE